MNIFTLGVYGRTEEEFFNLLLNNRIDVFYDIRRRRGMRGKKYYFVNSNYLQEKLKKLGIHYLHLIELSPDNSIREIQKKTDKENKVRKISRTELSKEFILSYQNQILKKFDFQSWLSIENLLNKDINVLFFCVERNPDACHRSLVARFLSREYKIKVCHL